MNLPKFDDVELRSLPKPAVPDKIFPRGQHKGNNMRKMYFTSILAAAVMFTAGSAFAAEHAVSIQGFKFSPANLTVAVGDSIVFTNNDGAPHTATSDMFDTGTITKGNSATVTISTAGVIDYKCNFHPMMKGKITAN